MLVRAQPEVERRRHALHLLRAPPSHNGRCNSRVMQCPAHRHHPGAYAVAAADLAQQLHQAQVAAQLRLVNSTEPRRQSSAGNAAIRSALIVPASIPDSIGE